MNRKTTGVITIEVPIPAEVFESHRQFHYKYESRHLDGTRIITPISFHVWYGEGISKIYARVLAESPIQRIKERQQKRKNPWTIFVKN